MTASDRPAGSILGSSRRKSTARYRLLGPCQARPEPVAMARFRDLSHVCRMHVASAGLSAPRRPAKNAPVAQLDRALDYESRGQEFESLRARHRTTVQNKPAKRTWRAVGR